MVNVGDSAAGLVRIHLLDGLHGCDLYYRVAAIPEARAMALAPPLLHLARRGEEGAQGSLRAACVLPDTEVADVGPPRVRADGGTWVVPVHRVRSTESRRVIVEVTLDRSLLEPASTFIALSVRVADAEYTGVIDVARGSDGPWRR